jgi:hypothetical protein
MDNSLAFVAKYTDEYEGKIGTSMSKVNAKKSHIF